MRVIIQPDYDTCSKWAADYVVYRINRFRPTAEKPFVLGLPTGSSPLGMYKELIKQYQEGKVSFANVVTFNMDEYIGLPAEHHESYHFFMQESFFKHVNIQPQNIHILNGMTKNYEKECLDYEATIKSYGKIHLFIGGVGTDGHIAFNEPGSSLSSRTRVKTLTMDTIKSNARFFNNDINLVPKTALTVGVATITDAQEVMIIATGNNKAKAVHHAVEGCISQMWPITILQMHQHALIICDDAATADLASETTKYFKEIENRTLA